MSQYDLDLFVIGGGSGGVRAARISAQHGARVAIAEEFRFGGTCVIRGCVPKKLLVYASRFPDAFEDSAGFGWSIPEKPTFSWADLIAAKNADITRISGFYEENVARAGVTVHHQRAVIEDPHTVRLADGAKITAALILIATGGAPASIDFPGGELAISSNEALDLPELPKRVIVQGGGYIALEFASIFAGLGAETTLIHRGHKILRGFDEDVRDDVQTGLAHRGVKFVMSDHVVAIERAAGAKVVRTHCGETIEADEVLFAIGRRPLTHGLGLEAAGVECDHHGAVVVDEVSQTSTPSIYAIGDVTNRMNLTPIAIREGHAFADRMFGGQSARIDYANVPTAVFTTPEAAAVGLTEEQAREKGGPVDIYKTRFRPMKATLSGRQERTMMKLVVDGDSQKVLGVHIVGEDAAEMVQMAAIAVKMGATKADFDQTVALHPTIAEEIVTLRTKWTG